MMGIGVEAPALQFLGCPSGKEDNIAGDANISRRPTVEIVVWRPQFEGVLY